MLILCYLAISIPTFPVFFFLLDFLDPDLDDDILCAKKIVKDPKGMGAW